MASLVLGVAGNIAFGPIGGFIGSAVGAYIDQAYLFPALFGSDDIQGPRLQDTPLQTSTEGSPVKYCLGPQNKFPGEIIWRGPLEEVPDSESVGGGSGGGGQTQTTYKYYRSFAIDFGEAPPGGVVAITKIVSRNGVVMYDNGTVAPVCRGITIYLGTEDQDPDPLIETHEGAGNVPGYRGRIVAVFDGCDLGEFGNQLPQADAFVQAQLAITVGEAITLLMERAGRVEGDDFECLDLNDCLLGYTFAGPQPTAEALEPLMGAFSVVAQDRSGVLTFIKQGDEDTVSVVEDDLAAHESESDGDAPRLVRVTDQANFGLPSAMSVTFIDAENGLENGSQRARLTWPYVNEKSARFPITMTGQTAQKLARTLLWNNHSARQQIEFTLPPSYIALSEGDIAIVPDGDEQYTCRVTQVDRGANFLMKCQGIVMNVDTVDADGEIDGNTGGVPGEISPAIDVTPAVMDIPAIRDSDTRVPGFYYGVCATDPDARWRGAVLYGSTDGTTYNTVSPVSNESSIGAATTALLPGITTAWDNANTVTVEMAHGELSSTTEAAVLNGANLMLVGDEIIAYQTATLVAPRTYTLSKLLRGLRDTTAAMSTHSIGDRAVVLNGATPFVEMPLYAVGSTRYTKAVAASGNIVDVTAVSAVFTGASVRPFAPCHVAGTRDGSNNLTLTWVRRTRALVRMFTTSVVPTLGEAESYEIDVVLAGVVVRTLTATSPTVAYSAANQTTDGITPGDPVIVRVYQISEMVGRGNPAEETV